MTSESSSDDEKEEIDFNDEGFEGFRYEDLDE